jgi:DNA (cytosine-5)-methyltransferase 3A
MRVLSLFDWIACGYEALQRAWIPIDVYYASEIDKYAIQIALKNHPDIIEIWDVTQVKWEDYKDIDIIIGGSPCQWFSMAWKMLNFDDPRSKLFFEFVRLVKEIQPKYFLLENVKMKKEFQDAISSYMWVEPIEIDSALVSAQRRKRLYWTNIPWITQPEDKWILLKDILEHDVDEKYNISEKHTTAMKNARSSWELNLPDKDGKCGTIIASYYKIPQDWPYILKDKQVSVPCATQIGQSKNGGNSYWSNKAYTLRASNPNWVIESVQPPRIRKLTPIECERLQTMPDNYTEWVSDTQRYKMLWNWWTCDVIAHIFSFINKA